MGPGIGNGAAIARSASARADLAGQKREPLPAPPYPPNRPDTSFPELDCVRQRLPAHVIAAAERRAEALGIGADRVLIASGALDEETYLRALGEALGIAFEPLDGVARARCPFGDERLIEGASTGLLPLLAGDSEAVTVVVAPQGTAARGLMRLIANDPATAARFHLTSAKRFDRFVLRASQPTLVARASELLRQKWPNLSAASRRRFRGITWMRLIVALSVAALIAAPMVALPIFELMLAAVFLAWLALRLTGAFIGRPAPADHAALPDHALPIYTIISALYREAASVNGLLAAIERLDYPHEKLDVIIAVEADDRETRAALASAHTRLPITVLPVPPGGPRTKPKALNVALPFARGTFTVIYDAEDRPEPNQLRCALQAFRVGSRNLACVQAQLCIDNTADSWLARYFTAEYAGQFDVFLPGLTALGLPLPLGGSSNHFYTATLHEVGGWDPYNVTEDADLGMRLVRFGYRADMIDSTTYEEAPARIGAWLRQRTRWFKGWMQTWLVHMRQPRRLLRDLGLPGFIAFQLMVGGNALAALVHPLFIGGLIYSIARTGEFWGDDTAPLLVPGVVYAVTAVCGYLSSGYLGWHGLRRRGLLLTGWVLLLTPLHWMLLSIAGWRAVYQLIVAPFAWEKTEHGLARTSHRAERLSRALLDLERDLRLAKD